VSQPELANAPQRAQRHECCFRAREKQRRGKQLGLARLGAILRRRAGAATDLGMCFDL
jgi:hypothetical protein